MHWTAGGRNFASKQAVEVEVFNFANTCVQIGAFLGTGGNVWGAKWQNITKH